MMNKKVLLTLTLPLLLCSFVSCNKGNSGPIHDGKTINIKAYKGGYGDEWLKALITKFKAAYPEYNVNYVGYSKEYAGTTIINELSTGYAKHGIDLYFTGEVVPQNVYEYVEDISDVYDSPAISFSGVEENTTIRSKMSSGYEKSQYQVDGVDYNFIYHKSIGGMIYNAQKLSDAGFDEPKTTNELIKICESVYDTYHEAGDDGILPMTLISSQTNSGYPACMTYALYVQYSGLSGWDTIWSFNNEDGSYNLTSGYEAYQDKGLLEMEKVMFHLYDKNFHADNGKQNLEAAHDQIMFDDSGAIFMCDGDWAKNEIVNAGYTKEEISNLRFMNFPVISALGTKLWGDQSTVSPEAIDLALSKAVVLADEGKNATEIATALSVDGDLEGLFVDEEEAQAVINARGVFVSRGGRTGNAYIAKGSGVSEAAKLFLRMFASDDNATLFREKSNGCTPYDKDCGKSTVTDPYFKEFANIATRNAATGIWPSAKGLRAVVKQGTGNHDFFPEARSYFVYNYIYTKSYSQYDRSGDYQERLKGRYDDGANERFLAEYNYVYNNWSDWISGI